MIFIEKLKEYYFLRFKIFFLDFEEKIYILNCIYIYNYTIRSVVMKHNVKNLFVFILVFMIIFLSSCGKGREKSSKLRIAFVPQLIGIPYFTAMEEGGKRAAAQFGNGEFLYVGSTSASSPEQNRLIENLIAQKVDAISVSVLDPSINAVLQKAKDAGIKVYTADSDGPDSVREVFVAQATDELLGRTLIDRLALQIGGEGEIGIVSGESTAVNLNSWINWMKKQVEEKYPKIKIVDVRYTSGGSTEDALKQAQELMTRYPNIKGIVAVASTTVPGVARAVEQANKVGQIAVIGYGSPATVKPYIDAGIMKESILWDPEALGFLTYWAGMKLTLGEKFEAENKIEGLKDTVKYYPDEKMLLLGDPLIIDKNNVASFKF